MAEIFETLSEEDLIINDVSTSRDVFPDSSSFRYLFDITEFVNDGSIYSSKLSPEVHLKTYQRNFDLLFGRQNSIIVQYSKIPSESRKGFYRVINPDYIISDTIKHVSDYGHFMIEFNLDVSDTIYWLYLLKFVCQIADDFNARKLSLINLSMSSLPVLVHEFSSPYFIKEEVLNVLTGVYQPSFSLLEQFMTDVIFYSNDARTHLMHIDVAQRIAYGYISAINTHHRKNKQPKRMTLDD